MTNVNSATTAGIGASTIFAHGLSAATNAATTPGIMAGFGTATPTATVITPTLSGTVKCIFVGVTDTTVGIAASTVQIAYGSGAPPNQGVAQTGTLLGAPQTVESVAAAGFTSYKRIAVQPALSVGTAYWFDIVYFTSNGTDLSSVSKTDCILKELLW
jgi:hypothetical protein